jgi:hypothetical protein
MESGTRRSIEVDTDGAKDSDAGINYGVESPLVREAAIFAGSRSPITVLPLSMRKACAG